VGVKSERVSAFVPLSTCVVLKRDEAKEATPGGLVIPEAARRKPRLSTVMGVGPGRVLPSGETVPCEVKKGDRVVTKNYRDIDMEHRGSQLAALREVDILAVVNSEGTYRPLGSRVVVERLDLMEKSESGLLHVPDVARENRRLARVVAVGRGRVTEQGVLIEPRVKVGDLVLTVKMRGVELEHGERGSLQILDESDCMCVVEQ